MFVVEGRDLTGRDIVVVLVLSSIYLVGSNNLDGNLPEYFPMIYYFPQDEIFCKETPDGIQSLDSEGNPVETPPQVLSDIQVLKQRGGRRGIKGVIYGPPRSSLDSWRNSTED